MNNDYKMKIIKKLSSSQIILMKLKNRQLEVLTIKIKVKSH